jgi:hypothetical protein
MSTKKSKVKKQSWFTPVRGSYLPANVDGWLLYIPYGLYVILAPLVAWQYATTWVARIFIVVPNWLLVLMVMTAIAEKHS